MHGRSCGVPWSPVALVESAFDPVAMEKSKQLILEDCFWGRKGHCAWRTVSAAKLLGLPSQRQVK